MNLMIVSGMFVCSSFLSSVCMFIVSKALLISSARVIVRAGGAIWRFFALFYCLLDMRGGECNNNNIYLKSNIQCT